MPRSASPLYSQIAGRLRQEVAGLPAGSRVASEPELARTWAVSRFTVARAMETLVDEGLLVRRQGSGTFKAEAPLRRIPGTLMSFTDAVKAAGHASTQRLLAFEPSGTAEGEPFRVGEPLLTLDRLRFVDGFAAARHTSRLPSALVDRLKLTRDVAAAAEFSLYALLERNGMIVERADERLIARAPSAVERELLDLAAHDVVIAVTRYSFAADGSVLDAVDAVYDARRYSYEARLTRSPDTSRRLSFSLENTHASDDTGGRNIGPRLGPWPRARHAGQRR